MRSRLSNAVRVVTLVAVVSAGPRALNALTTLSELRYVPDITTELGSVHLVVPGGTLAQEVVGGTIVRRPLSPFPVGARIHAYTEDAGDPLLTFDTTVDLSAFALIPPLVVESRDVVRLHGMKYSLELDGSANGIPAGAKIDAITRINDDYLALSFDATVALSGQSFADDDLVGFDGSVRTSEFKGVTGGIATGLDLDAALYLSGNGRLLLSFDGSGSVDGIGFNDEDVLEYDRQAASWELVYDGTAAPHNWPVSADLIAVWALEATSTPTITPTPRSTATFTPSPPSTDTSLPTSTPTPTLPPIDTPTQTPSATDAPTPSATIDPTATPTRTLVPTLTPIPTDTPIDTRTPTETAVNTATATPTPPATASDTPSPAPTSTSPPTATPSVGAAATASASASATEPFTPTPTGTVEAVCAGDCDGDGFVTVDEIITLVNVALGTGDIGICLAGDSDGDGSITVDEIIAAVNRALLGC